LSSAATEPSAGQQIRVGYREPCVNALLRRLASDETPLSPHFNQNEELFVELPEEYAVPSLPIHHDVRLPRPEGPYAASVCEVIDRVAGLAPGAFRDLTYAFDPADILKAHFHRLYRCEGRAYLYLLAVDMTFRPQEHARVSRGTNDATAAYRSRRLFVDAVFVPLDAIDPAGGADEPSTFEVRQSFSETWLGERGRGYFVQGIWIDHDLTRFFSKLFLPRGVRVYPFYPFVCRYRTICETTIDLSPAGRLRLLPYLHRALEFIAPEVGRIEREMRSASFSEDLPLFRELKSALPADWESFHRGLKLAVSLNAASMREFAVEENHG
jgi:hypothetical protein